MRDRTSHKTDPFGCHRVVDPAGSLPQNCRRLDNDPHPRPGEIAVEVELLNVDSSSFRQMQEQSQRERRPVSEIIQKIVAARGKLHNPVTGSGGMLLGVLEDGRRIATLVSLTLTPLHLESILEVDIKRAQVRVKGRAILFEKTLFTPLPDDLPETVALAVLDVAGAPAQCARLAAGVERVLLLGAGKSGVLAAAAIRRENPSAEILAIDVAEKNLRTLESLNLCDWTAALDAGDPMGVFGAVETATRGKLADLTVNLVNRPGTEGASILATRDKGTIFFFSMATSFSQAALTAEGVARDVDMRIGSGYTEGWVDYALNLLRDDPALRRHFEERYGVG